MSTPFGLFKAGVAALAEEKRWPVERYLKAFQEALVKGFAKYDERRLVVFIPKFIDYNPPASPNVLISWGKVFDEIPDCCLKHECCQKVKALAEGKDEAFLKAFTKAFPKAIAIQEQYQEQENGAKAGTVVPFDSQKTIWDLGVSIIGEKNRSLLGKLIKEHGEESVSKILAAMSLKPPADPKAYLIAALKNDEPEPVIYNCSD